MAAADYHVSYRNLPIGAAAFILLLIILRLPKPDGEPGLTLKQKISLLDFPGIILITGAVCCLVLALQWGGQDKPWNSADVIGLFVGAGLLLAAFCVVQWWKKEKATIPLRILRQRSIFLGAWYLFFLEMAIYVVKSIVQRITDIHGLMSTVSILLAILLPIGSIGRCARKWYPRHTTGALTDCSCRHLQLPRYSIRALRKYCASRAELCELTGTCQVPYMIIGQLVAIIGNVFLTRITVNTRTPLWATYLVVTGIGTGMGLQMPFTGVQLILR